jgi:hypothetical protein
VMLNLLHLKNKINYKYGRMDAILEEYKSIIKRNVWDIVPRSKEKLVVSSKWIYKIKHAADRSVEKFKERFVARGFTQKEGIEY